MATAKLTTDAAIARLIETGIRRHLMPGAVVAYLEGNQQSIQSFGRLMYEAKSPDVTPETVYDVASITKVLPTATLILMLRDAGKLDLADRVVDYVPQLGNDYREDLTIEQLITYTVEANMPITGSARALADPAGLLGGLLTAPLMAPPGTMYKYNDLPAILMGLVIERVTGSQLDVVAQVELFEPLGLNHTGFRPDPRQTVAPSEADINPRAPHDEKARALRDQGIIAGHAGLFTTAEDLLRFASMLLGGGQLDGHRYLEVATVAEIGRISVGSPSRRPRGWFIEGAGPDSMGVKYGTWHMKGYTGAMVMLHPETGRALALTANCLYPQRPADREVIYELWRQLARIVFPA